jgi:ADP-heptose:LPS heptosyltransferase
MLLPMTRVLVLRGGALGDFIVTLPALALLRRAWPSAQIELVGNARAAELGQRAGLLDRVHAQSDARWSALYAPPPLPSAFAAELATFDLVINVWPDPDGDLARHFPLHARQRFLSAPALPTRAPAAAHYCAALAPLGLGAGETRFSLGTPRSDARFIAIHPGSGSPRKNWPLDRWRALLSQLPAPVSLLLGEAELASPALDQIRGDESGPLLLANRPLSELVAHFRDCRLFLGHDSGVSHLAAACGVPCVLLFGPTDPAVWAPPGEHVHVLRAGPDLSAPAVADVLAAVDRSLSPAVRET